MRELTKNSIIAIYGLLSAFLPFFKVYEKIDWDWVWVLSPLWLFAIFMCSLSFHKVMKWYTLTFLKPRYDNPSGEK